MYVRINLTYHELVVKVFTTVEHHTLDTQCLAQVLGSLSLACVTGRAELQCETWLTPLPLMCMHALCILPQCNNNDVISLHQLPVCIAFFLQQHRKQSPHAALTCSYLFPRALLGLHPASCAGPQ
jgi:hypothetical protein